MTQGIALRKYSSTEHTTLGVATSYPKMLVVCSSWTVRLDLQVQQIPFELSLNLLKRQNSKRGNFESLDHEMMSF